MARIYFRVGDQPDTIARWGQRLLGKIPTPYPRMVIEYGNAVWAESGETGTIDKLADRSRRT
jgi:hypothetical protein